MVDLIYQGAYFGEPWPSGVCEEGHRLPTPVGQVCSFCGDLVDEDDRGTWVLEATPRAFVPVPVHRECSLRAVAGGIGHHEDHAKWCTEKGDPDAGRSYRQSALAVWSLLNGRPESRQAGC